MFVIGSATCASAWADAAVQKPSRFADRLKPSNDWQFIPRVPKPRPLNNSDALVREVRERYADIGASGLTLDELHAKGIGTSSDLRISHTDEILPDGPNQVVLMGEFRDFDVVLTSSRRSIYTEMHIFVERVLRDATAGQTITVFSRGGLIIANDGQVPTSFRYRL